MKRSWIPLVAGFVAVPALLTTLGFTVYGEELTDAFPSSSVRVAPVEAPRAPIDWAALEQEPPSPLPPTPDALQRTVSEVFATHGVKASRSRRAPPSWSAGERTCSVPSAACWGRSPMPASP